MIRPIVRPIVSGIARAVTGVTYKRRYAYNFDGVDDMAFPSVPYQLTSGGSFKCKFMINALPIITGSAPTIFGVTASNQFHTRALINPDGSITTRPTTFGTEMTTEVGLIQPLVHYTYLLTRTGDLYQVYVNGQLKSSVTVAGGQATIEQIGMIGGLRYFGGLIYDVEMGGTYWPISEKDYTIQLPVPSGLGEELISVGPNWVSVNASPPVVVGSYIVYNDVPQSQGVRQPDTPLVNDQKYVVEFEVYDYVVGSVRPILYGSSKSMTGTARSTNGKFREVLTISTVGGSFTNSLSMQGFSANNTLKVRNISVKPLGTCNPLTMVNTTPARWEVV